MSRPADLPAHHRQHLDDLLAACAHLSVLTNRVRQFAGMLTGRHGEDLDTWMTCVDADDLPALHGFVHGLRMDLSAVVAGLTLPYSNGPIEGANTKVKLLGGCGWAPAGWSRGREPFGWWCDHVVRSESEASCWVGKAAPGLAGLVVGHLFPVAFCFLYRPTHPCAV